MWIQIITAFQGMNNKAYKSHEKQVPHLNPTKKNEKTTIFGDSLGRTPSRKPKKKRTLEKQKTIFGDSWLDPLSPRPLEYVFFCFFSGAFRVFIFSESWLDSPIPKTTYEICFCSILLFQSWYRLAFILSFATHHAHHCPTLKTQHQLQSI